MKKAFLLISVGVINTLHGLLHLIQFIQSIILVGFGDIHGLLESPIFSLVMGIIGILSLVIGIKDFIHHRKCNS